VQEQINFELRIYPELPFIVQQAHHEQLGLKRVGLSLSKSVFYWINIKINLEVHHFEH